MSLAWVLRLLIPLSSFCTIIYILFLILLIKKRNTPPFNSGFFALCVPLGIGDILALVTSYGFVKLPKWGGGLTEWYESLSSRGTVAKVGQMTTYGLIGWQSWGVLMITINRYTAIKYPFKHTHMWTNSKIAVAAAWQVVAPILTTAPQLFTEFDYVRVNVTGADEVQIIYKSEWALTYAMIVGSIIVLFVSGSCLYLYVMMFILSLKHSRVAPSTPSVTQGTRRQQRKTMRREIKFATCGFATFVAMFVVVVISVLYSSTTDIGERAFYSSAWCVFSDFYSWMNPFLIFFASQQTRIEFVNMIKCKG